MDESQKKRVDEQAAKLRRAAAWGDLQKIKELVGKGALIGAKAPMEEKAWENESGGGAWLKVRSGDNAAMVAAREGHEKALVWMVASFGLGKPWSSLGELRGLDGEDLAMCAVGSKAHGAIDCLDALAGKSPGLALPNDAGDGLIRRAAIAGNAQALAWIQERSAALGQPLTFPEALMRADASGRYPLMWAVESGKVEAMQWCVWKDLKGPGKVRGPGLVTRDLDAKGEGLWMMAARSGSWEMVEALSEWASKGWCDAGVELDRRSAEGHSALDIAARLGALDACKALWKLRSDPALGESARLKAKAAGKAHVERWLESLGVSKLGEISKREAQRSKALVELAKRMGAARSGLAVMESSREDQKAGKNGPLDKSGRRG